MPMLEISNTTPVGPGSISFSNADSPPAIALDTAATPAAALPDIAHDSQTSTMAVVDYDSYAAMSIPGLVIRATHETTIGGQLFVSPHAQLFLERTDTSQFVPVHPHKAWEGTQPWHKPYADSDFYDGKLWCGAYDKGPVSNQPTQHLISKLRQKAVSAASAVVAAFAKLHKGPAAGASQQIAGDTNWLLDKTVLLNKDRVNGLSISFSGDPEYQPQQFLFTYLLQVKHQRADTLGKFVNHGDSTHIKQYLAALLASVEADMTLLEKELAQSHAERASWPEIQRLPIQHVTVLPGRSSKLNTTSDHFDLFSIRRYELLLGGKKKSMCNGEASSINDRCAPIAQ